MPILQDLPRVAKGAYCGFALIDDHTGIKSYGNRMARDRCYQFQRLLHKLGLAPAAWFPFNHQINGCTVYCYTTEVAVCYTLLHRFPDFEGSREYYDWDVHSCNELSKRLEDGIGLEWADSHGHNVGYLDGQVVLIDCDPTYFYYGSRWVERNDPTGKELPDFS